MELKSKVVVLGVNEWKMDDGKEGVTVFYLPESPKDQTNQKGYLPVKKSFPRSMAVKLRDNPFPAVYDINFTVSSSSSGKLELDISDFKYVQNVELWKK